MSDSNCKFFSKPLMHLLSLELGRSSPLDSMELDVKPKVARRVRFNTEVFYQRCLPICTRRLKSILKKKDEPKVYEYASGDPGDVHKIQAEGENIVKKEEDVRKSSVTTRSRNLLKKQEDVEDVLICENTVTTRSRCSLMIKNEIPSSESFNDNSEDIKKEFSNTGAEQSIEMKTDKPRALGKRRSEYLRSKTEWASERLRIQKELDDDINAIFSAKDLKIKTFQAWEKTKKVPKTVEEADGSTTEPLESLELKESEAFREWKLKKDSLISKKKLKEAREMNSTVSNKKVSENQEVFDSWKEKKDNEAKKIKKEKVEKEKEEQLVSVQSLAIQKQDAAAAFRACKRRKGSRV